MRRIPHVAINPWGDIIKALDSIAAWEKSNVVASAAAQGFAQLVEQDRTALSAKETFNEGLRRLNAQCDGFVQSCGEWLEAKLGVIATALTRPDVIEVSLTGRLQPEFQFPASVRAMFHVDRTAWLIVTRTLVHGHHTLGFAICGGAIRSFNIMNGQYPAPPRDTPIRWAKRTDADYYDIDLNTNDWIPRTSPEARRLANFVMDVLDYDFDVESIDAASVRGLLKYLKDDVAS